MKKWLKNWWMVLLGPVLGALVGIGATQVILHDGSLLWLLPLLAMLVYFAYGTYRISAGLRRISSILARMEDWGKKYSD